MSQIAIQKNSILLPMLITIVIEFITLFLPLITLDLGIFGRTTVKTYDASDSTAIVVGLIIMSFLVIIALNRIDYHYPSMKALKILAVLGILGGILGIFYIIGSIEIGVQQIIDEYDIDISDYLQYESGFYLHIVGVCLYLLGGVLIFTESRKLPVLYNSPPPGYYPPPSTFPTTPQYYPPSNYPQAPPMPPSSQNSPNMQYTYQNPQGSGMQTDWFCPKCGRKNPPGRFCMNCGYQAA
jgi:hypothetical protein